MDNAPGSTTRTSSISAAIRLADIDGSGTNDIIYLHRDGVRLYFNQSGNRLSDARRLHQSPPIDNVSSVMTADLLGNGTACLVWSSPLPGDARRPMRYVDLMGRARVSTDDFTDLRTRRAADEPGASDRHLARRAAHRRGVGGRRQPRRHC